MTSYAEMVREAVEEHGPVSIPELFDRMGIPRGKRGTRASLRGAVYGSLRTGALARDADGRLVPGRAMRPPSDRTEERIRRLLSEGRAMTVVELADRAEVEPGTVRRHLRRMGAVPETRGRTAYWSLGRKGR